MKTNLFTLFFLLTSIFSNSQNVTIINEALISKNINYPLNEPHLITDPNDPNHLLVASILTKKWDEGIMPESHIVLLQSWDAGKNWNEKHFNKNITSGSDPWLSMNKKGVLILTSLNILRNEKWLYLLCFTSTDNGKTWNENFLNLGAGHDRQSIVVDPKTNNFIIVSGKYNINSDNKNISGIMVSRLASNGTLREANWHAISNVDKNNGTPIINSEGVLLVPYVDYIVNDKRVKTRRNWLIKSTDLGRTFAQPILINEDGTFPKIMLDTFDLKKPKLHSLKSDGKFREYKGFSAQTSTNEGYSWSDEVDVDQFVGEKPYIRNAEWVINKNGIIGVFWYDRRGTSNTKGHDLYFSYSKNNAKSFEKPIRISSKSSIPNPEKNGMTDKRWPTGGDYFGVDVTQNGMFRVIWVDYRNDISQLFHAVVNVNEL